MTTPEQWLKTMPGTSWRDLDQLKEWIEAIQEEAFNEGVTKSAEMCGGDSHIEEGVLGLLKKPLAKSQEGGK